jgi:UDP-N-acetyl-2-amino-2-deoxyglucuronate dehydrogenase
LIYIEVDYWHGLGPSYTGWSWAHTSKPAAAPICWPDAMRWMPFAGWPGARRSKCPPMSNNTKGLYEYDANVVAVMKLEDGTIAKSSVLAGRGHPLRVQYRSGRHRGLAARQPDLEQETAARPDLVDAMPTILPDSGDVHHHPFDAQINHFVDCIREDRQSHCSVADAYRTHELCLAIDRSIAEGGRTVRLPLE